LLDGKNWLFQASFFFLEKRFLNPATTFFAFPAWGGLGIFQNADLASESQKSHYPGPQF